jgi:hypothetical protein
MAWGWRTGLRSQPGPSEQASLVQSRPFRARRPQTAPRAMLTGLIPSSVRQTRACILETARPTGTGTGPGRCSDSNARKRAHDSTTSHLTTRPHDTQHIRWPVTLRARGTTRGVQQRRVHLLFPCPRPRPHPRHCGRRLLSRSSLGQPGLSIATQLSGRLFFTQCAAS